MLKRDITYEDFDGEKVTETFHFHIAKNEIVDLEVGNEDGLEAMIKKIIKTNDRKGLIDEFKKIILLSYGQKSSDGKRFEKSDELRTAFSQHAAYDVLFMELATDADKAIEFIKGVLPKELRGALDAATLPPPDIQPVGGPSTEG